MAIINVYTRKGSEQGTEPATIPRGKDALPGTTFLHKRAKPAEKSLGFAAKCGYLKPGSKWTTANGSRENTVVVDYITQPGEFQGKPKMISVDTIDPSEPCYVSFTDSYGTPTGYTPLGTFLFRFPLLAEPVPTEQERTEPEQKAGKRKVTALDLGAIV